jgi:hypothetical protein
MWNKPYKAYSIVLRKIECPLFHLHDMPLVQKSWAKTQGQFWKKEKIIFESAYSRTVAALALG